jgi:hypothetical protein
VYLRDYTEDDIAMLETAEAADRAEAEEGVLKKGEKKGVGL